MIKNKISELSVIIPLYNEEKRFPQSFKKIDDFFNKKSITREYIFVNDGSSDKTLRVLQRLKSKHPVKIINHEKNQGKGAALKTGVASSAGKYIFFTDADLSTPIEEFDKLYLYLKKYEMVIGSRRLKTSNVQIKQPFHRRFLGSIFYFIFSAFFTKNIKDTNCGFKAYRRDVAINLYGLLKNTRWGFDAELIYLAEKLGYSIKEVPVIWLNDPNSRVSSINAVLQTIIELLKIKINYFLGRYKKMSGQSSIFFFFFNSTIKLIIIVFFKVLFFFVGEPVPSQNIRKTVALYGKDTFFNKLFTLIRLWDSPYEELEKLVPKKGIIIDLGCGDGFFSNYLAITKPERRIIGIEVNHQRITYAYKGLNNTKFIYGDITKAQIPKADSIVLIHVLHHLNSFKDQEELIKVCSRKLKEGGKIIILEIDKTPWAKYLFTWFTDVIIVPILFERRFFNSNIFYRTAKEWRSLLQENLKNSNISVRSFDQGKPFSHILITAYAKS